MEGDISALRAEAAVFRLSSFTFSSFDSIGLNKAVALLTSFFCFKNTRLLLRANYGSQNGQRVHIWQKWSMQDYSMTKQNQATWQNKSIPDFDPFLSSSPLPIPTSSLWYPPTMVMNSYTPGHNVKDDNASSPPQAGLKLPPLHWPQQAESSRVPLHIATVRRHIHVILL